MIIHFRLWLTSLKHYGLMCLFVSSPERLPQHLYSIYLSMTAYLLLGITLVDQNRSYITVIQQVLLELALLAMISYAVLKWRNKLPRFKQTFSALVGVNLIISAFSIPLYQAITQNQAATGEPGNTAINASLIIILWGLAVVSLIFKRALNTNTFFAAMLSFNYFLLYQFLVVWIS